MSYISLIARLLLVFLLFASPVLAASVSITPSGDSAYTVQGAGMDGVAGIQLNIAYDAASLVTPTVTQGGLVDGAMLAVNTSLPGSIKIAIISTKAFSGSGLITTISFASKPGSGGITSANVSMINSAGTSIPASVSIANASGSVVADPSSIAGLPFTQPAQTSQTSQTGQLVQTGTATTPAYPGTVTLPTDQQQLADSQPEPSSTTPVYTEEPPAARIAEQTQSSAKPAAVANAEETPQYVVYKGILDRFKQFNGSKTLPAMVALFEKKVAQTIHQEPAILLSDGHSKATLTVDIPARINSSPNFAVNGGTLVSFKQDKQSRGRWIVEVLPDSGSIKVTVTIIARAEEFDFPLTVTPPVKTALTLDKSGWDRFLNEVGTAPAPKHDFNNDGVRDYMDEFIFVANSLLNKVAPSRPAAAAKTPEKK